MDHEQEDSCVYVKEAVLHELEQERRKLKWQLSRALRTSDTRAAELTACQAKVKDLLTIVEVNKGVADQVLQRSHSRDTQRRAECEAMRKRNAQQRQWYVGMAMNLMSRRVRDRQQRDTFHALHRSAVRQRQFRRVLQRLQGTTRRKALKRGLDRWTCFHHATAGSCRAGHPKVNPLSQGQFPATTPAFLSNEQLVAVNGPSTLVERVHKDTLRRFTRWRVLRNVWRNWERIVRRRRKERNFLKITSERLLRSKFAAWRSRARTHRQRKVLLRRFIAKKSLRLQQLGFVSFRLRCSQITAFEWAAVLKTAHAAMEEERMLRSQVQSSVTSEMHDAYLREQHRQQQFTQLHMRRLEAFKRRECKHRALIMLRYEVMHSCHQRTIAFQFQRRRGLEQITRKVFTSWKRESKRSKRIKNVMAASKYRRTHATKTNYFKALIWALQRNRQRRLRLHALLTKQRRALLFKGWLRLRIRSAIEGRNAIAHVELWQLTQQAEVAQAACLEDVRRAKKIVLKYQVMCALLMADRKHENCLRGVFNCWSRCVKAKNRQRRALKGLIRRWRLKVLQISVQTWDLFNKERIERCNQLCQFELTQQHRTIKASFVGWRRGVHERARLRMSRYLQRSYFQAWRRWYSSKQQRVRWFRRFLMGVLKKPKRSAFQHWKRSHDYAVMADTRREAVETELIVRMWRRWIGFLVFRLHNQRSQQRKVLSGVRRSLQRTVLSSAFVSWQKQWRQRQSRWRVIVLALRENAGRVRLRKCLQGWHQYFAIMGRRRAALNRIIRRQRRQVFQRKWRIWMRAALRSTIALLETSSIKVQRQVNDLVREMMRVNTLRRTLQRWRVGTADRRQQRRRREMYVEKRRYEALQDTFRQWLRGIASFPLTKQRRLLQRLVNRLRISFERRAFGHWCRWTQRKTLLNRDMISAELFSRSERRVVALAAGICANKERRLVLVAWKAIVEQKKTVRKRIHGILKKHHRWLLWIVWVEWTMYTQRRRCIERLGIIVTTRLKAAAWSKFVTKQRAHDLKSNGAQRAGVIWHRILLRHSWHRWKRIHHVKWREAALTKATASSVASMIAFKETIAIRHHKKHSQALIFSGWKQHISYIKLLHRRICNALGRQVQTIIEYHFQKWRKSTERHNRSQELLLRVVKRQHSREVRSALNQWRTWALEQRHCQQLEETARVMIYHREASAKIVAAAKFLAWQRPCLEAHFIRWKVHIEQRHRFISERIMAHAQRRTRRLLHSFWQCWSSLTHQTRRRTYLLTAALNKMQLAHTADGFGRWARWMHWMHTINESLGRLSRIHDIWQYRRGITVLRQNQHEVIRRQSVMAATAFAAHSARQRDRQAQLMRGVALFLQRKTSTALCGRCFRQWMLYVKSRVKTEFAVRMIRLRSLKRVARRYLTEWHFASRQEIVLRQIIHRRQEVRASRRQRRVWNAWALYTKHSLDMKHLIYDRLVICALRHTLQGVWVQWKSHTRHANSLLDAQRVMHSEQAAAQRDQLLTTLEEKHKRVLLRAAQLGQLNNILRHRQMTSAAKRLLYLLDGQQKARVAAALGIWKHQLMQIRALQMCMTAVIAQHRRLALRTWHRVTTQLRIAADVERVELDAAERTANIVHMCGKLWLKRRIFTAWREFTRAHREISRRILVSARRQNQRLALFYWASWKSILALREQQEVTISAIQARKELKVLARTFFLWRGLYRQSCVAKHNAVKTFLLLRRNWERRVILCFWNRWRSLTMETSTVLLQAKLMVTELEFNQASGHVLKQLLRAVFSSWKLYALSRSEHRKVCTHTHAVICRRRLLYSHFSYWKRESTLHHKRILVTGRLLRYLRRHYTSLTRYSFWLWFARVQAASPLLTRTSSIQLQLASKRLTPAVDAPAAIARALLIDLLVTQRQLIRSQQRSAWRLVNATARSARRLWLQTAFHRLANGIAARCLLVQNHVVTYTTAGHVFANKMAKFLLRLGFQRWKAHYLTEAIREAEEAQDELLHALHHVSSYRQTLDPYATKGRL